MKLFYLSLALGAMAMPAAAAPTTLGTPAAVTKAAIDPERLALASKAVESIWPIGTAERMMKGMMDNMQNSVLAGMLDSTAADLGIEVENDDGRTLREKIAEKDPHFEERFRITNEVMGQEMMRVFAQMEPAMRTGLANAYARRFTVVELTEINRFFASPAGASYARQSMELITDKEFTEEMMAAGPQMMKQMPAIIEKLKKATAHLPLPVKDDEAEEETEKPSA